MDRYGISNRIKELRGDLPQRKFATMLGVSQAYISDLERRRKTPSVDFLLALSEKFNVTIDWILKGDANGPVSQPQVIPLVPIHEVREFLDEAEKRWFKGDYL